MDYKKHLKKVPCSILSIILLCSSSTSSLFPDDGVSNSQDEEAVLQENRRVLSNLIQAFSDYESDDFDALRIAALKALEIPSARSNDSDEMFQSSSCRPEHYIKAPMLQTAEQLKEPDVFKKFRISYTSDVPLEIDILISKINRSKLNSKGQKRIEKFDIAHLQNANFMNTVLLYGEPGNGKTYMVGELARALQVNTLWANGSLLQSSFRHQSATNIKAFFDYAKAQNDPLIIFIDEIDPIAGKQVANNGNSFESTDSLKMLLDQLDEIKYRKNLFVITGTNHLYWLERAFIGRFDSIISIERPKTEAEYKAFFEYSYAQHGIDSSGGESDRLASRFYNESTGNPGWFSSGSRWNFSRRHLSCIIPFILAARDIDCEKKGVAKSVSKKIDVKNDALYIQSAIEHIRSRCSAEHLQAPSSREVQILERATRGS